MAGPTAGVILSMQPGEIAWRDLMTGIADEWLDPNFCWISDSTKCGGTYLGEPRPFVGDVYTIRPNKFCGCSPEKIAAISRATETEFTHNVELGAMSKSASDHRILCEVARCLAARHQGYVDFCGEITDQACPGLVSIRWLEEGEEFKTQLGTPAACDWWLRQESFHMIK